MSHEKNHFFLFSQAFSPLKREQLYRCFFEQNPSRQGGVELLPELAFRFL